MCAWAGVESVFNKFRLTGYITAQLYQAIQAYTKMHSVNVLEKGYLYFLRFVTIIYRLPDYTLVFQQSLLTFKS